MKHTFFAYLVVAVAATSLLAPGRTAAQNKSNISKSDNAATKALLHCLLPKAQYSELSSYDGGKSALKLLKLCPDELYAYLTSCEAAPGRSIDSCGRAALVAAQVALKQFGK